LKKAQRVFPANPFPTVENLLVFGNRNREKDYFFRSQWESYQSSGDLSVLLAFSRDGPLDEKKTYVQDMISRNRQIVHDYLIGQTGVLFISGSSGKMPQGVKEAVIDIIMTEQGISREEAVKVLADIERQGRWKQETW
jgi:sulfite reductase alpha subunit-like flavoprotein